MQRFPYVALRNKYGEVALRPQLPFTLVYHGQSLDVVGLLDTGADVNVLPYRVGLALGATWEAQPVISDLSGNLANYEARGIILTVLVGQFAPVELGFVWSRAEDVPLLLGQVNFFIEFQVCFYRWQGAFELNSRANLRT
ncbi:MAG: retroviral-like aspartic protease [Anaerolineae bacterium]|nr:retroviral-like aspartic protease [Anaerolineae bacterium]